jgi:WD40 repeat protein
LRTLYQILGVKPRASLEEVRKAYRKLAREYHPDVNPEPAAHDRMAQINSAFEVLGDPVRRSEYDASIGQTPTFDPSGEESVRRPDVVVATLAQRHRHHKTPIYGVAFTKKGRLVSSSFDNELVWWDEEMESPERTLRLEGGVVNGITAVGEDMVVAVGSSEQSMACWTVRDCRSAIKGCEEVQSWRGTPKAWVATMAASPNGQMVALGSVDNVVRVLSAEKGSRVFEGTSHKESVTAVAWSSDSRWLASGSADASVKIWDARRGIEILTLKEVRSTVTALAFSPNGTYIAVAAVDLSIRVFEVATGRLKQKFFGHTKPVEALAFHPRNWLLASASRDGTVGLWSILSGIGHGQLQTSHQPLSCVAFSPKGDTLATGGLDKLLRIYSLSLPR